MKTILLASASVFAFSGMAFADGHATPGVAFAGSAALGYNDDVKDGFYWDASVDVTMTAALDNGLVASATFGLNVADNSLGDSVSTSDYVLTLSNDMASLSFGDIDPVAEDRWGGVSGMSADGFNDADTHFAVGFDAILVGEVTLGGTTAALSYGVATGGSANTVTDNDLDALQVYITSSFGSLDVELAYQDEFAADAVFAVGVSTSFGGADVDVAFADNGTDSSIGIGVSYPVAPGVTVSGYYAVNDVADDAYGVEVDYVSGPISVNAFYDATAADNSGEFGIEGSYDVGNGLTAYAGFISTESTDSSAYYVAGTYDLGGGAELLVSFADDGIDGSSSDEIGDPEYLEGTTVEVSFDF